MNTKLKTSKYSLCVNSCMCIVCYKCTMWTHACVLCATSAQCELVHVYCVLQVHNVNSHVSPDMVLQAEHWVNHWTLNSTQSVAAANIGPWQLTWVWCNWCQYWLSLLVLCYVLVMWVAFVFRVLLAVSMFGSLGQKFCHCVYNLCWLKCNT